MEYMTLMVHVRALYISTLVLLSTNTFNWMDGPKARQTVAQNSAMPAPATAPAAK